MDVLNCQMRNMALRQPLNGLKVSKDTYNKLFFINTHSIDATVQVGIILPRDVCQALLTSFVLQVTWFVALLTLDERRVERGRNGCCCCILQRPRDQPECEEREEEKPGFMSRSTYKSQTHAECCYNAECSPGSLTG